MATDFTQESVLRFLLHNGGDVRNADLLSHFKPFLREHEDQARNRELFKKYVNAVATVKQEDGVSYVILRKKYRPHLGDIAARTAPSSSRTDKKQEGGGYNKVGAERTAKPHKAAGPKLKTQVSREPSTEHILPAAGIVNKNYIKTVHLDKPVSASSSLAPEKKTQNITSNQKPEGMCPPQGSKLSPDVKLEQLENSGWNGERFEQPSKSKGPADNADIKHNGIYSANPRQLQEADGCSEKSFYLPPDYPQDVTCVTPPPKNAALEHVHDSFQTFDDAPASVWPFPIPFGQSSLSQISASSPCLNDIPTAASYPHPYRQRSWSRSNDNLHRPDHSAQITGLYIHEPHHYEAAEAPVSPFHQRCSLPLDASHPPIGGDYMELYNLKGLSSSQSSLLLPSFMNTQTFPQENWSSDNSLNYPTGILQEQLQASTGRPHELELQSHLPERQAMTWHSTGHLLDAEPQAYVPGSAPANNTQMRPVARKLSQHVRSRMCRSLGADLDRASREDGDTARLKRLHRITSFLNVTSGSSSLIHSPMDSLSPAGSLRSLGHDNLSGPRHAQVPLEPQEHEWFVKAAEGNWADVYSLFREDPSLLAKRDFVTGYTVLHWIAKHGDHRVLNTLWYGVKKVGVALDVDARTTCGYTPLHVAAIHGHKNLLRLLVHKFKANVAIRDNNGKKPWQYLEKTVEQDLLDLLGAQKGSLGGSAGMQWHLDKPPVAPAVRSSAAVKRNASLAALFKNKSHLRVSANAESLI